VTAYTNAAFSSGQGLIQMLHAHDLEVLVPLFQDTAGIGGIEKAAAEMGESGPGDRAKFCRTPIPSEGDPKVAEGSSSISGGNEIG